MKDFIVDMNFELTDDTTVIATYGAIALSDETLIRVIEDIALHHSKETEDED